MAGLIFLAALGALIAALIWLSGFLTRRLPLSDNWKKLIRVVIVAGAFPLILIDEIIGKYQFEALCRVNGIEGANASPLNGKTVNIHDDYFSWTQVPGKIIPIEETRTQIKDALTGQVLVDFKNYRTTGGWLMRHTPLSMGSPHPMLFGGATCNWNPILEALSRNNVTLSKN